MHGELVLLACVSSLWWISAQCQTLYSDLSPEPFYPSDSGNFTWPRGASTGTFTEGSSMNIPWTTDFPERSDREQQSIDHDQFCSSHIDRRQQCRRRKRRQLVTKDHSRHWYGRWSRCRRGLPLPRHLLPLPPTPSENKRCRDTYPSVPG